MKKKILEITDIKSRAIYEYIVELSDKLREKEVSVDILNWRNSFFDKADIYHYHYSNSTVKILLSLLIKPKDKNFVTLHDVLPRNKLWRTLLSQIIYRIIDMKSKKIVTHSIHAKEILLTNFKFIHEEKLEVVPFLSNPRIYTEKRRLQLRNKYKLIMPNIVFLYIGYLKKSKGIVETLKAFEQTSLKNIRLFIIGKPSDVVTAQTLNEIRDDRIKYLGFVSDKELDEWLIVADCLLNFRLDTAGETSAAVIKGISYGKPILATNVGSTPEVVSSAGIICDKNPLDMKKALEYFSKNTSLRDKLLKNASVIRKQYSWINLKGDYLKLFGTI